MRTIAGWIVGGLAAAAFGCAATAQNTSGVFGPVVTEGDRSIQLRSTFSFDGESSNSYTVAHRFHYQHAFSDTHRGRVIVLGREAADGDFAFQYLQGEWLWQYLGDNASCWRSALRADVRYTDEDFGDDRIRLNWTNQCDFADGWRVRALAQASRDVGEDARVPLGVETRASLTRKLATGPRVGVELFNSYGRLGSIGEFDEQSHQLGPVISGGLGDWSYQAGVLAGVSERARDTDLRLWIGRSF